MNGSVCPSVCPSVTPFWLCSHHHIIMKFSGVITSDKSDVHAKGRGQRSKVKVTEVMTPFTGFRTVTPVQGWGQFRFFNSIPIPLFSIPIPIPLLTISFNSNSNSRDSNSNSGDFRSRQSQFQKWPVDVFLEIDYNYTNQVHVLKLLSLIPSISYPLLKGHDYMASWLILYEWLSTRKT